MLVLHVSPLAACAVPLRSYTRLLRMKILSKLIANAQQSYSTPVKGARPSLKLQQLYHRDFNQQQPFTPDQPSTHSLPVGGGAIYLNVPRKETDQAKLYGASYDRDLRKYYISRYQKQSDFERWFTEPMLSQQQQQQQKPQEKEQEEDQPEQKKIFLKTIFAEKEEVKSLGASWDPNYKKWFIYDSDDFRKFARWLPQGKRVYLTSSFFEKDLVKSKGAKWDMGVRKWYITEYFPLEDFKRWLPPDYRISSSSNSTSSNSSRGSNSVEALQAAVATAEEEVAAAVETVAAVDDSYIGKRVMIFDIETSGLPPQQEYPRKYPDFDSVDSFADCRIVQISFLTCDAVTMQRLHAASFIIKSDGFAIDNSDFHGVTLQRSLEEGVSFEALVTDSLQQCIADCDYIVAHNAEFDVTILKSELHRYALNDALLSLNATAVYCSMHQTKALVGKMNWSGDRFKSPSLKELYHFATGKEIANQHDATHDVANLHEALCALTEKQLICIPSESNHVL